jgi:hypothetical protein
MRHVMIAEAPPSAQGLQVTEVIVIDNPAMRTWIGVPVRGGANPKRITTAFALPRGAHGVTLGRGFHDWCCSTLADGRLINHLPLMPGATEMMYSYLMRVTDGSATIDIAAPAGVDHMMVLVPESMTVASSTGLQAGGVQTMGENRVQSYFASNLHAGDAARIQLAGLRSSPRLAATGPSPGAAGALASARMIAAIGGGVILLAALALLLRRGGRRSASSASPDAA